MSPLAHPIAAAFGIGATALLAGPAFAAALMFTAELDGGNENPPNPSNATGALSATFDTLTRKLTYTVTYEGLSGPAVAAHFHGPAAPGQNAGVQVPVTTSLDNPIKGAADLTEQQAKALEAGQWYFNIHTKKYPDGEIRGQVTAAKE